MCSFISWGIMRTAEVCSFAPTQMYRMYIVFHIYLKVSDDNLNAANIFLNVCVCSRDRTLAGAAYWRCAYMLQTRANKSRYTPGTASEEFHTDENAI